MIETHLSRLPRWILRRPVQRDRRSDLGSAHHFTPPKLLDTTGIPSRAEGDSSLARLMLALWVSYSVVVCEGDLLLHHPRNRRRLATAQVWASRVNPLPPTLMTASGGTLFEGDPSGFPLGARHTVTLDTMT
jgi:hypothetical protein